MIGRQRLFQVLLALFLGVFAAFVQAEGQKEIEVVRIGFIPDLELNFRATTLKPTVDNLAKALPEYKFEEVEVSAVDTVQSLANDKLDFFIAPSGYYLLPSENVSIIPLATRKSNYASVSPMSLGSVFIVRSDRQDIQKISDLRGKTVVASFPNSIGGWLASLREVKSQGFDPDNFYKKILFTSFQAPDVFNVVLFGRADAGILPTCMLETAEDTGLLQKEAFRVLEPKNDEMKSELRHKCLHSTSQLYPDLVFATLSGTPEPLAKKVAIALLSMPGFGDYSWSIETDTSSINDLFRDLKLGQFAYLSDNSLSSLYKRYKKEFWTVMALLLILILNEIRLHWLVNRRTAELRWALKEKERTEEAAKEERKKLSLLERNSVISQMGSLIAHEAKQPIGTILNYIEVMRMYIQSKIGEDEMADQVLNDIDNEAQRLNKLIDSVRNFAKKKTQALEKADLVQIAQKAIRTFHRNEPCYEGFPIDFKTDLRTAMVKADVLSLELLILNLIRNGAEAYSESKKGGKKPFVGVVIEKYNGSRYRVEVWNKGDEMTDEQMKRLISLGESVKSEGLGIGLAIIRNIADHHGADLIFRKRKGGGVSASLYIDREESN